MICAKGFNNSPAFWKDICFRWSWEFPTTAPPAHYIPHAYLRWTCGEPFALDIIFFVTSELQFPYTIPYTSIAFCMQSIIYKISLVCAVYSLGTSSLVRFTTGRKEEAISWSWVRSTAVRRRNRLTVVPVRYTIPLRREQVWGAEHRPK